MSRPTEPVVTVVVPTVDRVDLLDRCLRGLADQEFQGPYEVIVVHDGDPGVVALLTAHMGAMTAAGPARRGTVRAVRIDAHDVSSKRNAGWQAADADLVAFTDDDCQPAPRWLAALVDTAGDDRDLVAGPVAPHPDDADVTGVWARTVSQPTDAGFYPGCNLLVRKSALERTGGFDVELRAGEDTDLAWRLIESGGTAAWAADALVWHAVRAVTFAAHLRSLPRWAGLPLVVRRHPQLRDRLAYRRWFWKDSHPAACLALAGVVLATVDRRALVAVAPVIARRVRRHGPRDGLALAVGDVVEAAVVIGGSLRYGTLLL